MNATNSRSPWQRPFSAIPNIEFLFRGGPMQRVLDDVERCIERAEGVACIFGSSGLGKSLACQQLVKRFSDSLRVVLLNNARLCTRRALLQSILFELNLPFRNMEEGELRLTLTEFLRSETDCPQGMLLIVDEVHTLPSRLLEEIRLLTNLVCGQRPAVRLVLSGTSVFEERLAASSFESLNQRIVVRSYLGPFNGEETRHYIRHQLDVAGESQFASFDEGALAAIISASNGVPRIINQLCDHSLLVAEADGRASIDAGLISRAWSEIQQLPAPWQAPESDYQTSHSRGSTVIEFGELESASEFESQVEFEPLTELQSTDDYLTSQVDIADEPTFSDEVGATEPNGDSLAQDDLNLPTAEPVAQHSEVTIDDSVVAQPTAEVAEAPIENAFAHEIDVEPAEHPIEEVASHSLESSTDEVDGVEEVPVTFSLLPVDQSDYEVVSGDVSSLESILEESNSPITETTGESTEPTLADTDKPLVTDPINDLAATEDASSDAWEIPASEVVSEPVTTPSDSFVRAEVESTTSSEETTQEFNVAEPLELETMPPVTDLFALNESDESLPSESKDVASQLESLEFAAADVEQPSPASVVEADADNELDAEDYQESPESEVAFPVVNVSSDEPHMESQFDAPPEWPQLPTEVPLAFDPESSTDEQVDEVAPQANAPSDDEKTLKEIAATVSKMVDEQAAFAAGDHSVESSDDAAHEPPLPVSNPFDEAFEEEVEVDSVYTSAVNHNRSSLGDNRSATNAQVSLDEALQSLKPPYEPTEHDAFPYAVPIPTAAKGDEDFGTSRHSMFSIDDDSTEEDDANSQHFDPNRYPVLGQFANEEADSDEGHPSHDEPLSSHPSSSADSYHTTSSTNDTGDDDHLDGQILREIVSFRDVAEFNPADDPVMPEFRPAQEERSSKGYDQPTHRTNDSIDAHEIHRTPTADESEQHPEIQLVDPVLPDVEGDASEKPPEPPVGHHPEGNEPSGKAHREDYESLFKRLKG